MSCQIISYCCLKASPDRIFRGALEKSYAPPNQGDWIASPYYYFAGEFSRFTCVLHSAWSILWHEIDTAGVVIFGGGGLIDNSNALNDILNRLFLECDNVVIWGAGTHKYSNEFIDSCDDSNIHNIESATISINFDKGPRPFAWCKIRGPNALIRG